MPSSHQTLTFGHFRIDLANATLWQGDERLALKPKSFAVLRTLLERPQQLVTKEELLAIHWNDVAVSDAVLKTCIGEIRQALGESAQQPTYIETVHRRGYRFLGTPIPVTQIPGSSTTHPFVGREQELNALFSWWEAAKQGNRHVIFVTGEPGIGKTSLVDTFLSQLTASDAIWIGRGHCIEQYGAGEAYLPILEALGRLCRQPGGEALVSCLRQYAPTWLMHLPGLVDAADVSELLPTVIGATPVRMMRELADALEEFTQAYPVILSLEDLHWLDAASLELLTYVAHRANPARILVLGTYRPADLILLKHPLKHTKHELLIHGQCQELQLECLTERAVVDYLQHRFTERAETDAALHSLAHVVYQRTEGNPLFMVNLVDYFVSHDLIAQKEDVACATIPTGLRQFIEVRVAQLDPEDRQLSAMASISGMEFSAATIEAGLGSAMTDIDRRCADLARGDQFIRHLGIGHWPDGTTSAHYEFQHALYQETLYDHVPLTQRMAWHRQIGERLEQGYGEHTRDIAAELALHFERGQDPDRASTYHQQAGEEAFKRSAHHEAILHLTAALKFLQTLAPGPDRDQRELPLQSLLGLQILQTNGFTTSEGGQALARAHELCQQFPNNPQFFPNLYGLFRYYVTISDRENARDTRDQLVHLAQQTNEAEALAVSLTSQGGMAMFWGAPQAARPYLEHAISLNEGVDSVSLLIKYGEETRITCRHFLSWVLWTLGFPDQSKAQAEEALLRAKTLNNPFTRVFSLLQNAITHMMQRDYAQALSVGHEALALAQQHAFQQWEAESLRLSSSIQRIQGKTPEGGMSQEPHVTLQQSTDTHPPFPCTMALMIESTWQSGQYQEGLTMAQNALDGIGIYGMTWYEAEWVRLKGELLLSLGESNTNHSVHEAEACFQEAIEISQKQDTKMFELRAIMSLSRLWQQQGKGQQARPKLKKIYDWFTEGFDTRDLQDAKTLLDSLE